MPIIPKSTGTRMLLLILLLASVFSIFYFRVKDIRSPIVTDMPDFEVVELPVDAKSSVGDAVLDGDYLATTTENTVVKGLYRSYGESELAKVAEGARVVLFFNASWCPTCQTVDKELLSSTIPDNLVILSVDYDSATELRKKYLVTYQHTFVEVDADGNMIQKWSGGGLENIIKKAI